jgi:hypothetical protein
MYQRQEAESVKLQMILSKERDLCDWLESQRVQRADERRCEEEAKFMK